MIWPSWLINMEFAIAFTAPSLPISICSGMGDVWSQRGGRGGRLFGLCVFCTMLRSSSSYSINPLCILVEKNIKHMKIYLWEKSVFGCVKVLSVKNIMVSNSVWLVRANPNERKKRKKERSMEAVSRFTPPGGEIRILLITCVSHLQLVFFLVRGSLMKAGGGWREPPAVACSSQNAA